LSKLKKIVFLTGTRADFGKLKSLIKITQESPNYDVQIFATGMHLDQKYGFTINEIHKSGFKNISSFKNNAGAEFMDRTLANTIEGFSKYISNQKPDLIVVHGDRVEALAGAIVGSLNTILVAHIEGGEISGTIDELIRHSVSKLSHLHLVSHEEAKKRLIQMGELESSVYIIGSPDLDLMNPLNLPKLDVVKKYYNISFDSYAIAMFHSVTTEYDTIKQQSEIFINTLIASNKNYILIYPNNDLGTDEILETYEVIKNNPKFKIFPSLRFEYFLKLLKEAEFIIGNSSAGVREAPFYKVPTIDIGTRQNNRAKGNTIIHVSWSGKEILNVINNCNQVFNKEIESHEFGEGNSDALFYSLLNSDALWNVNCQKQFQDL
jgi:UDP-N-acetylglucosamine 2-epimerase (hydrolysing)